MDDKTPETGLSERLRASEDSIDQATLDELKARRQQALKAQPGRTGAPGHWQGWLLAASVAVIAVLIVLPRPEPDGSDAETFAVLEEGPQDDIDLYENLEFYEWLAAREEGDLG